VLIQLLWSYYALWQFWFLSRSKTLGWSHTARFFVIGAWVTTPLSALIVWSVHSLGEGEAETTIHDEWSSAVFGPIVEETVKLLPLLLLLLLSRRVRSFSLTDYLLVGAATGTGFDFLEEVVRTWAKQQQTSGLFGFLYEAFDTTELVWEIDTLFPGYFRNGDVISPGHHVWTAFVALGIGMAHRLRQRWGRKAFLLPGFLFIWAVFDHGAYNASLNGLSSGVELLYLLSGYGHFFKWGFVVALIMAVFWDFREINRVSNRLPRLPKEKMIEPVSEFLTLCLAFLKGRQEWGHALLFLRERRQMAFSLLYRDKTSPSKEPLDTLARRRAILAAALGCLLLVAIGALLNSHSPSSDTVYFAGLIDDLAEWWEGLSWYEKAAVLLTVLLTAALLTVATGGGWITAGFTGLSAALTLQEVLSNPQPVTSFLRNPTGFIRSWWRELRKRPPQEAAVAVTALLAEKIIERIPAVKVLNRLADSMKDTAQRIAKKLWKRDTIETPGGRRMDSFSTNDSIRYTSKENLEGTSKDTLKRVVDPSSNSSKQHMPDPNNNRTQKGPIRDESGNIDWEKQFRLPVEDRVKALQEAGVIGDFTDILNAKKGHRKIGALGELQAMERKLFEEGANYVEKLPKVEGQKNPDLRVDGELIEVKSRVQPLTKNYLGNEIKYANKQIAECNYDADRPRIGVGGKGPQGSVEFQFNGNNITTPDGKPIESGGIDWLENEIKDQLIRKNRDSIKRIAVYHNGKLILEVVRTNENNIITKFIRSG
jgi:RsiW-degrading membrane proteinase PrsW (M82 family)